MRARAVITRGRLVYLVGAMQLVRAPFQFSQWLVSSEVSDYHHQTGSVGAAAAVGVNE